MNMEELIPRLQLNHFYPSKEIKEGKVVGLKIESPELLKEDRIALVKKIVGDGFTVKQGAKELFIMITEKKSRKTKA